MKKPAILIGLVVIACFVSWSAEGAEIAVPGDYATIQEAIDAASKGDEIIVSQGTFYENIEFKGIDVTLRSGDPTDPAVVEQTIINGTGDTSCIKFKGTESPDCVLSGFTITGGFSPDFGGGIRGHGAQATIENNIIQNNYCSTAGEKDLGFGGGIFNCHGTIRNNTIKANKASWGGGLAHCHGSIEKNTIDGNETVEYDGGGLYYCNGTIRENGIKNNTAKRYGGGVSGCSAYIVDNVISKNKAQHGAGVQYCHGTIYGNIVEENEAVASGGGIDNSRGRILFNTIQNNIAGENGGGINLSDAVIENNTITSNKAAVSGGGLNFCQNIIRSNIISHNTSDGFGGGMCTCNHIINNKLYSNTAKNNGGGARECSFMRNNLIYNNSADDGAGICDCYKDIVNNVIYNNTASNKGGGIYNSNTIIKNNIVWGNIPSQIESSYPPSFCCIQDWSGGDEQNITDNPMFKDPANGNFELDPASPCIDKGDPDVHYNDKCNFFPGIATERNDMGAYGGPDNCGWTMGYYQGALGVITEYGDAWASDNYGVPPFSRPSRRNWLGFRFDPANKYLPLTGNADGEGLDDLIQITQYGDAWVSVTSETDYGNPTRWGWLGFHYDEKDGYNGWIPFSGDANGDGNDDLIQVTEYGDAWVARSSETMYRVPERWGWLGFEFSRAKPGENGATPLAGDVNGDRLCDLVQITKYEELWISLSRETLYEPAVKWGVTGFKFAPQDGWYPICADVNGDGRDDLVQVPPTGVPYVSVSAETMYTPSRPWGTDEIKYDEAQGLYPLAADVNADGLADLVQIDADGDPWVALSKGDSFGPLEYWGPRVGYLFSRDEGYLPFYVGY